MTRKPLRLALAATSALCSILAVRPALAETQNYLVFSGQEKVGTVAADIEGRTVTIAYDVKNNGRGPTIAEHLELDAAGLPQTWTIDGTSTFLSPVHERFARKGDAASWTDSTGSGSAKLEGPALYLAQNGSPWQLGVIARALLAAPGHTLPALPGGTLSLEAQPDYVVGTGANATHYKAYLIKGIDLEPETILLDDANQLVAVVSPRDITLRAGLDAQNTALEAIAADRSASRYAEIEAKVAHHFDAPVRLRNVRIFDPATEKLGAPVSLVFFRDRITAIEPLDEPSTPGEVTIDGKGKIVLPGLHDMHAHLSMQSALMYIASGVTSVRDMGNDNAFLLGLQQRIDKGELAGPRIVRNGFLEGRSPYSSRNGIIVASEKEAVDAVRWYAARGYWQIKIYNSMHPEWVPAVTKEAHLLGMHVTGHIPAFTDADHMIAAGYDEITHLNQLMLGWVLKPGEDTRTPLRLTAMRRTAGLDLNSEKVRYTLDTMQAKHIAHGPTAVTLELLMLSRNGQISPAVADYFDHLPIGLQRRRKQGIAPIAGPADDAAYKGAFETIKKLLKNMHDRGIVLLPGTDDQTGLSVHRELEIYTEAGIPNADVLYMDTLGPERYMHRDQWLGSVERNKYADFILLDGNPLTDMSAIHKISMVVKGGTVYFPSEIWNELGVKPFAAPPQVTMPPKSDVQPPKVGPGHDDEDEFLY